MANTKKESVVLVLAFLLFLAILVFIDPSYTAYTSMNKMMSNNTLSFINLIVILIGAILFYKLIMRKK